MSLGRKAAVGAGWMIAWRAASRLLGVVSTLILARLLVPADFGIVAMAMTFEVVLQRLAAFPVYDVLLRRPETDTDLHDVAFTIQVARAVLTAAILAACAPLAAAWFAEPRLVALVLALATVTAVNGLQNIGIVEFSRDLRFDVQFKLQLAPLLLQMLATIGIAWVTRSYWALLIGLALSRIGRVAMSYIVHPYRPQLSLRGWRELMGFSFWLWLTALVGIIWNEFDPFIVGRVFGSVGLGLYTLALQVAQLPTTELVEPLAGVLFASFAYALRDRATVQPPPPLRVASALLLPLALIALVISADAGDIVNLLLGTKWSVTVPLVVIAAWGAVFYPVQYVCGAVFLARGEVRRRLLVTVAGAVLRILLISLAALTGGLPLVIEAMVAALGGGALFYLVALNSELRSEAGRSLAGVLRIAAATAAASFLLITLHLGWQPMPPAILASRSQAILRLCIEATAATLTYSVVVLALWRISGCPAGPEKTVIELVRELTPLEMLRRLPGCLFSLARR